MPKLLPLLVLRDLGLSPALASAAYDQGRFAATVEPKMVLLDQNRVIRPNPWFRLFSTTNTIGLGDTTGLYHGTQQINQGQMDRWSIISALNYLPHAQEVGIVAAKSKHFDNEKGRKTISNMVRVAG